VNFEDGSRIDTPLAQRCKQGNRMQKTVNPTPPNYPAHERE